MNEQQMPPRHNIDPLRGEERRIRWKLWGGVAAFIVLAIFVLQNTQDVEVKFLFTSFQTPLIFALLLAALLGALVGWLVPIVLRSRGRGKDDEEK